MADHDPTADRSKGVTRRGFLGSVSAGAVAAATGVAVRKASAEDPRQHTGGMIPVALQINGRLHRLLVEPRWSLLYVLREELGLTGSKAGCERGECGSCTVLIDGAARYACLTLAVEVEGVEVTTLEGLLRGEELGPTQQAFAEEDAFQCGYCTPGQIMAAEGLLRADPSPDLYQIRTGMSGNLCRCGTYAHIAKAVGRAAELKKAGR
jgi:xanthine dehydrogenase YagT iron-sulfur-binding subunit